MFLKLLGLPLKAVLKVGEIVHEEADKELYNLEHIQQQLIQLQTLLELEEISDEDFYIKEEDLIRRYEIAKKREQQLLEERLSEE